MLKKEIELSRSSSETPVVNGFAEQKDAPPRMWGFARYLALVFLILVLTLSVFLSLMIGNRARGVLVKKQYEFATLLSENLNHQIFRRFTLPTLVGFGRIALRQPAQYERLDQLIQQIIHGMNVQDLRIYDHGYTISYCTDSELLGRNDLASAAVRAAMSGTDDAAFQLDSKLSFWESMFTLSAPEGSYILRTVYPLRIENRIGSSEDEGPIMGVLEFTQDISADMQTVIHFQWTIIAIISTSCLLIFILMIMFLRRAERALAYRVQEKEKLIQILHQHEKLAGMGRVIAGIAHEIRNPLGIISSSAQLLLKRNGNAAQEGKEPDKVSVGILQAINDESIRLSQTVTDFLDYARPRSPRQDDVNLLALLEQAAAFMHAELEQNQIELIKNYNPDENNWTIKGDKDLLYRALYNILGNAVQAVPHDGSGRIELALECNAAESSTEKIDRATEKAGNNTGQASANEYIEICVSDNGPGFNDADFAKFLDPFYTTKPNGSGLGLPIVNSIVTSHSGSLKLANVAQEKGHGAFIRIILPSLK